MSIHVQGPDGSIAQFPDGTPPATITAAMQQLHGAAPAPPGGPPKPAPTPPKPAPAPPTGYAAALPEARKRVDRMVPAWQQPLEEFERQGTFGGVPALQAGMEAAGTFTDELRGKKPGYTPGDMYKATRDALSEQTKKRKGLLNTAAGTVGGAAGLAIGGGEAATAKGLSTLGRMAQGAKTGAVFGGAAGAAGEHDPKKIVGGATEGAVGGAALGTVAEPVVKALQMGGRAVNAMSGNKFVPAIKRAEEMLSEAFRKDGVDANKAAEQIAKWKKSGVTPALMDVGGKHVQQLIKKAGNKGGEAQTTLEHNAQYRQENLAQESVKQAQKLVREKRPASEVREALEKTRTKVANERYPREQQHLVKIDDRILSAVSEKEGRRAIMDAAKESRIMRDSARAKELENLISLSHVAEKDGPEAVQKYMKTHPQHISAGALDMVQSALQKLGKGATTVERVSTRTTKGFNDRAQDIAGILDSVPALKDARRVYRMHSEMIDGFDKGAEILKDKSSVQGAKVFAGLNKGAKQTARIGAKQALEEALGGQAVATLRKIQSDENMKAALTTLFGADEAARYSRAAKYRLEQLSKSQKVTQGMPAAEGGLHTGLSHTPQGMGFAAAKHAIGKAALTMSQKEADALAALGKAPAERAYPRVAGKNPRPGIKKRRAALRAAAKGYGASLDQ